MAGSNTLSSGKLERVPDPTKYSGKLEALDRFEAELESKFSVNANRFPSVATQVYYVFSYLRGDTSGLYLNNFRRGLFTD